MYRDMDEPVGPAHAQWEYKRVCKDNPFAFDADATFLGLQGWEMVSFVQYQIHNGYTTWFIAMFKRLK